MAVMTCVLLSSCGVTLRVCAGAVGETLPKPWRPLLPLVWLRFTVGAMGTRIRLCGRLEVELEGQRVERRLPGRQGPLVLAMLVLNRGRPVARDELIGALWPGEPPADPDEALSALLSKIRQAVGRETLTGRRELTLSAAGGRGGRFRAGARGVGAGARRRPREATTRRHRRRARPCSRSPAADFSSGWTRRGSRTAAGELEELRLRALEAVAEAGVALGGAHLAGAERAARELVRAAPLREAGHRLLMEALAARGEVAEALAAYEELRVLLRDELGMAPGAATRALHERLLAGEPARARPAPAGATPQRVPLPALLARERGEFVGRERELESLRRAWQDARAGHRRLVLLGGGPGIGKTRLAGELAREAHAGGTVLYGGCQEEALVSYQPFVEALRHYVRSESLDGALTRFGAGGVELARLIPELAQQLPHGPEAVPDDPETRRYLMFEAVSALLSEACGRAPVLLVLDDLHWADRSTLQLLRHLVRAQDEAALLILGSYRDLEVAPEHPLPELLADLRRDRLFERLSLEGLDRRSVEALIDVARRPGGALGAGADRPCGDRGQSVLRRGDGAPSDRDRGDVRAWGPLELRPDARPARRPGGGEGGARAPPGAPVADLPRACCHRLPCSAASFRTTSWRRWPRSTRSP